MYKVLIEVNIPGLVYTVGLLQVLIRLLLKMKSITFTDYSLNLNCKQMVLTMKKYL